MADACMAVWYYNYCLNRLPLAVDASISMLFPGAKGGTRYPSFSKKTRSYPYTRIASWRYYVKQSIFYPYRRFLRFLPGAGHESSQQMQSEYEESS